MARVDTDGAIALLSSDAAESGLFTDFDGTLSPIVPDPEQARPLEGAVEALRMLVGRVALVAVVSGRPAAFLASRFGSEPGLEELELYGLHGLERWDGEAARPVEAARPWVDVVARLAAEAIAAAPGIPGLVVEDKTFGLTLHWRRAADPGAAEEGGTELAHRLAREGGMTERPGKASVELVPPIGIDKGSVVAERGGVLATVAYLGDDVGDVSAFEALDRLESEGKTVLRVAVAGPEAPSELVDRADLVLEGPEKCVEMLATLGKAVEAATFR